MKKINFKRLVARNNRLILAYEKKYAKQIGRALQKQLRDYLKTGILSDEITPVLTDMYMKVGERFYLNQYKLLSDISQKNLFIDAFKTWWTNYVGTILAQKVTRINETTLTKLQNSLGDLIPQSLEFEEMASRLMKDFDFSIQRAMTISRTEVGNSMNEAKYKGKDDIKEELGEEIWKIWIHRGSKNPRDWHLKLDDGKAIHEDSFWSVETPSTGFTEKMDRPHDSSASAENVINCGCEVMYISYSYAKNNGMIDVTDYPITQPPAYGDGNETITIRDLPPSTDNTIVDDMSDILSNNGININRNTVEFDNSISIDDKNIFKNQLNKLSNEYNTDFKQSPNWKTTLRFKQEKGYYGAVKTGSDKIYSINFGSKGDAGRLLPKSVYIKSTKKGDVIAFIEKSRVDKSNFKVSTLTHEYAHIIADVDRSGKSVFFNELRVLRKDYNDEFMSLYKKKDIEGMNAMFIGKYAQTNISEFMAESFTQYKLSSTPSPYAVKVGKLIDKHFKK